jgi:hypothetical protein
MIQAFKRMLLVLGVPFFFVGLLLFAVFTVSGISYVFTGGMVTMLEWYLDQTDKVYDWASPPKRNVHVTSPKSMSKTWDSA